MKSLDRLFNYFDLPYSNGREMYAVARPAFCAANKSMGCAATINMFLGSNF